METKNTETKTTSDIRKDDVPDKLQQLSYRQKNLAKRGWDL